MKRSDYLEQLDVNEFLERPEVAAYIGKNYEHFKTLWQKDYAKKKNAKKMSAEFHWNTLAFFIPFAWFAYRKMWQVALGLAAIMVALTFFEGYAQTHWNYKASSAPYAGVQLVIALTSKNSYFFHVTNFFRKHQNTSSEELLPLAQKAGGVSTVPAIFATIGFIAALVIAAVISELIWPSPTGE